MRDKDDEIYELMKLSGRVAVNLMVIATIAVITLIVLATLFLTFAD
jgi:hypothetical protein